jgi:hypothetical protein
MQDSTNSANEARGNDKGGGILAAKGCIGHNHIGICGMGFLEWNANSCFQGKSPWGAISTRCLDF